MFIPPNTAISSDHEISITEEDGTSLCGHYGISISGDNGISIAGVGGIAATGQNGTVLIKYFLDGKEGIKIGTVKSGRIKPFVKYRLDKDLQFEEVLPI